jgi:hypothetical protein
VRITKRTKQSWVLVVLLVLLFFSLADAAAEKGEQLRRSMAEIALLNGQMAQRKDDALSIRETLSQKLEELNSEAREVLRTNKIRSRIDALEHPRIYYNLLLMAEIEAYMGRYTEKISYYRVACDRLSYLYQQADDDLKIVNTLSDLKIDALIAQTEKILDGYLPDAQTIVINPATLAVVKPENLLLRRNWVKD